MRFGARATARNDEMRTDAGEMQAGRGRRKSCSRAASQDTKHARGWESDERCDVIVIVMIVMGEKGKITPR
jgi:hypothetical protein